MVGGEEELRAPHPFEGDDRKGHRIRRGNANFAARLEHGHCLSQEPIGVLDVLDHLTGDDEIERARFQIRVLVEVAHHLPGIPGGLGRLDQVHPRHLCG